MTKISKRLEHGAMSVMLANGVTFMLSGAILVMKLTRG
jgi:hypothetical protein